MLANELARRLIVMTRLYSFMTGAVLVVALAACATTARRPDIRVNTAPDADFTAYSTFGFPEQTGTDRGGYSTLVTDYFKAAVRNQMEARGYHYVEGKPDLLVNFFANVREHTEVRSDPTITPTFGYYRYRFGLYSAWPLYTPQVETVRYPVGTANIDVVDARKKQLIWEGVAEGRVSDRDMDQPQQAIASVVTQLFARFPGRAGIVDPNRAQPSASPRVESSGGG
jgi:hypothetical protein